MKKPTYRKHGQQGYGFVEYRCKRHRLPGAYNSPESLKAYEAFCAAICRDVSSPGTLSTRRLLTAFQESIRETVSRNYHYSAGRVLALLDDAELAETPVLLFQPVTLRQFQRHLSDSGLTRKSVINYTGLLKQAFKWGVSEGHVTPEVWYGLMTVPRATTGKESTSREPVKWVHVEATLKHLPKPLCDMVYIQWLTGVRSGSLVLAAGNQFHRNGKYLLWLPRHKTERYGKTLAIPVGPIGQLVFAEYLRLPPSKRFFGYSTDSYCKALRRLQERKRLPRWTTHQLRHAVGHRVRELFGVEAAQAILGHSRLSTTEVYSARRLDLARDAAWRLG